jgi:hypothetical protein
MVTHERALRHSLRRPTPAPNCHGLAADFRSD